MKLLRGQPLALKLFGAAFLAQAAMSATHSAISSATLLRAVQGTFETNEPSTVLPFVIGVRLLFAAALAGFVYFRASTVAKWLVVFIVLGRLYQIGDAWTGLQTGNPHSLAWTGEFLISLLAVACLFTSSARGWFARKGRTLADDVADFE